MRQGLSARKQPSSLAIVLLMLLALSAVSVPVWAQGVAVTPTVEQKFVNPGEFSTVSFTIENTGPLADTYTLSLALPSGWMAVSNLSPLSLASGASQTLFITFLVPPTTVADRFMLDLTADSQGFPAVSDTGRVNIDVRTQAQVQVQTPLGQQVLPGSRVDYHFTITNNGNVPDIFEVTARTTRGFSLRIVPAQVGLLPGNNDTVNVSFDVPLDAETGVDQLMLTVSSTVSPEVVSDVSVLTQILPPTAEAVVTNLLLTIPAQIGLLFTKDFVNDADTLSLDFHTSGALGDVRLDVGSSISDMMTGFTISSLDIGVRSIPDDGFNFNIARTPNSTSISSTVAFSVGRVTARYFTSEAQSFSIVQPQTPTLSVDPPRTISNFSVRGAFGSPTGLSLTGDMTLSDIFGDVDRSGRLDLNYRMEEVQAKAGVFLTGPNFNGGSIDQEGLRASAGLSSGPYLIFPSFELTNNNVNEFLQTTSHKLRAGVVVGIVLPELPVIRLDLSTEKAQTSANNMGQVINGPTRFIDRRTLSISYELGPNSLSMSQRHEEVHDELTGDIFFTDGTHLSARSSMFSPLILSGSLDDAITRNQADQIVDFTWSRVLSMQFIGNLLNGGIALIFDDKRTLYSANLAFSPSVDMQWSLGFNIGFLRLGPSNPSKTLTLGVTSRFALPLPVAVKGQLEGTVFVDENENGVFDAGDTPLSGLVVNASGQRVSTNANGFYRTPPVDPGMQEVYIEELPSGVSTAEKLPMHMQVLAGQRLKVNIPLKRVAAVSGIVFNDGNRNGVMDDGEGGLTNIHLVLLGGGVRVDTMTNANGRFGFANLQPGNYRVVIDENSLPDRFDLTTSGDVSIEVISGGQVDVRIGASEKQRQVVITFRPPQAVFEFSPAQPRVGETVMFNASDSFDPDGSIKRYDWDFDGDGQVDATTTSAFIEHAFATDGTFEVMLRVTDNDNNTGQVSRTIMVTP